jgi:hypothetical protein
VFPLGGNTKGDYYVFLWGDYRGVIGIGVWGKGKRGEERGAVSFLSF